ncbi:radical SAM protein [Megasphaera sueciensis]|uniref:radical SAM protein n=1 Tax=Megasphaera sueciensis TaxID=349094 RepID=UPI003D0940A5
MSWRIEQKLAERLAEENGYYKFPFGSRHTMAICYPNTYEVGMSNLGMQIIYREVNCHEGWQCERAFVPDKELAAWYEKDHTPLLTIENQRPLCDFELIGLSVNFEMDYFNVPYLLTQGRISPLAAERTEKDPLIIMGGPVAFFNPEPLTPFVDVCIVGEGEKVIHDLLKTYTLIQEQGGTRQDVLDALAGVPGLYVPSLYIHEYDKEGNLCRIIPQKGAPASVARQWEELTEPGETVVTTPHTEFGAMYLIEIARGCGRHCRFCMAGYCYRRPRVRPLSYVKEAVLRGKALGKKIGLMGAAISDYPQIDELVSFIRSEGLSFSCASLRADSITPAIVKGLAESGQRTITLAPEAGSKRMRDVINKGITDEDLFRSIDLATAAGIMHVRLYIMIGLPWEEDEDIEAIVDMTQKVKDHMKRIGNTGKITLSINPFIPKPCTPFQWMPMASKKVVEHRLDIIKKAFHRQRQIELLIEPLRQCYIQGVLSRGDRRVGEVVALASRYGGVKGWKRAVKEYGLDVKKYLYVPRPLKAVLPWQVLDMGLAPNYLIYELGRARKGEFTKPCWEGCQRCHVCGGINEY